MLNNFFFLGYLFCSLFFGRKNPYYYLILPLALMQGPSAFISQDVMLGNKYIFSNTSTVFSETLFVFLLGVLFLVRNNGRPGLWSIPNRLIKLYLVYVVALFFWSLFTHTDTLDVMLTVRPFAYIIIGYYIWLKIWSSGTREQFISFLQTIMIATLAVDILYILNSSQLIEIYDNTTVYSTIREGRYNFYRDFKSIPIFGLLSFIISLIMVTQRLKVFSLWLTIPHLVIFPFVILFTFTRSFLILVVFNIAMVLLLNNLVRQRTLIRTISRSFLILVTLAGIWIAANHFFSSAFAYFQGRIAEAVIKKTETDNVAIRFTYVATANKLLEDKNMTLTGQGFVRDSYPEMERIGAFAADSTITLLFLHTGYFGVALVYLIWIAFTIEAFFQYRKTKDWMLQYIGAYGISTILVSLLMGTDIRGGLTSLMIFALLSVYRYNLWHQSTGNDTSKKHGWIMSW